MPFLSRQLPHVIERRDLEGVLSLRGSKLTYLSNRRLWVVQAGEDPRAWCKPVDSQNNGTGPWQHRRPPCDRFLRHPSVFRRTRNEWINDWKQSREREQKRNATFERGIANPIWQRGRRPDPALRTFATWEKASHDEDEVNDGPLCSRSRVALILRWDAQNADEDFSFIDPPRPSPMITTEYLRERHDTLRRHLRLNQVTRWAAQFPPDAIRFLERNQFSNRRWHLLALWTRVPEGRELFWDLPQLAWMLASSWNVKCKPVQKPFRSLRALLRKPRSEVLKWLDLPPGKGTLNLLRRIRPVDLTPKVVYWLKLALRDERSRSWLLNMEGRIDSRILYLLGRRQPITFPIAQAILRNESAGPAGALLPVYQLYFHIRKMLDENGREDEIPRLARIHSPERLREWHDRLIQETNVFPKRMRLSVTEAWRAAGNRVPPPIEPTKAIQPLATPEAIACEGRTMHHCLNSHSVDVAQKKYYAYAIDHQGERATLGLWRQANNIWRLAELRGSCNAAVSAELRNYVYQWLANPSKFAEEPEIIQEESQSEKSPDEWIDESEFADAAFAFTPSENEPF